MPQFGIAMATTLGGWLNAYLLWSKLHRHRDFVADDRLRRNVPLIIAATIVMAGALLFVSHVLAPDLGAGSGFGEKTSALVLEVGLGMVVFAGVVMASGVMSLRQLRALIGRGGKA
jgi:putative peptidoglycan lipid II flippase